MSSNIFRRGSPSQIRQVLLLRRGTLDPEVGGLEEDLFRDLTAIAAFLSLQDNPSSIRAFMDDEPSTTDIDVGRIGRMKAEQSL